MSSAWVPRSGSLRPGLFRRRSVGVSWSSSSALS